MLPHQSATSLKQYMQLLEFRDVSYAKQWQLTMPSLRPVDLRALQQVLHLFLDLAPCQLALADRARLEVFDPELSGRLNGTDSSRCRPVPTVLHALPQAARTLLAGLTASLTETLTAEDTELL